jgi:hypothetical protein
MYVTCYVRLSSVVCRTDFKAVKQILEGLIFNILKSKAMMRYIFYAYDSPDQVKGKYSNLNLKFNQARKMSFSCHNQIVKALFAT